MQSVDLVWGTKIETECGSLLLKRVINHWAGAALIISGTEHSILQFC